MLLRDAQKKTSTELLMRLDGYLMEIKSCEGVNRHLVFRCRGGDAPDFEVVTYAGHLVFRQGDQAYVFAHGPDMFDYFSVSQYGRRPCNGWQEVPNVDPAGWAGALVSVPAGEAGKVRGVMHYEVSALIARIRSIVGRWMRAEMREAGRMTRRMLRLKVERLCLLLTGQRDTDYERLNAFAFDSGYGHLLCFDDLLSDFDSLYVYTPGYVWACHCVAYVVNEWIDLRRACNPNSPGLAMSLQPGAQSMQPL